jgi:hypothetical protein
MPEIIDLIGPPLANCASFTVNNAVDSVVITLPVGNSFARNVFGSNVFVKGDSFRVLSMGFILPESFTFFKAGAAAPFISISVLPFGKVTGQAYVYPGLASGFQFIPMENYELVMDLFFSCKNAINSVDPTKTLLSENFQLSVAPAVVYNISMLGVPAALNAKVFYIVPFLKILHNLPMTI